MAATSTSPPWCAPPGWITRPSGEAWRRLRPRLEKLTMKVLVTGAAGFIGMHTVLALLARGDEVVGTDNLNDYYDPQLKHDRLAHIAAQQPGAAFRFEALDLADGPGMAALFERERFDGVVHLAAQAGVRYSLQNPQAYAQSNLVGFVNVLEGCRHHGVWHLV